MSWLPGEAKAGTKGFKNISTCPVFHFVSSEEKVSRAKRKLVSSCLGITYLAPGISITVGAKLSQWRLRINYEVPAG